MVEPTISRIALMSLKPKYADAILSGRKTCEFRRTAFAQEVSFVVIYATKPVGQVVGIARVTAIEEGTPEELWTEFQTIGGITEEEFVAYYLGAESGIAITLDCPVRLPEALALESLSDSLRPPQSFLYLSEEHIEPLAPWLINGNFARACDSHLPGGVRE